MKPPEPQIRIIKEVHIPPGEVWVDGPWIEVPTLPVEDVPARDWALVCHRSCSLVPFGCRLCGVDTMTRSSYLSALFGCVINSVGWFFATDTPVMRVCVGLLAAMWAARLVYVYRQHWPQRTVTAYVPEGASGPSFLIADEDIQIKWHHAGEKRA